MVIAGISAASAIYATQKQAEVANAQEESIRKAAGIQQDSIDQASRQQQAVTTEQMSERSKQAMQDEARLEVAAGERGAGGGAIEANSQQIAFNKSADVATLASNLDAHLSQATLDKSGVAANAASRLNQIEQPDWVGTALQVGSMGAKAYYGGGTGKGKAA
ncbi:virion core protein, T7 gp14 family [Aquabacterium sp.]|uniref:virion core protein, T7 gp14 family n=1 Tax=Aquabacterium sp. TaxID=1872578 RepID=UPI004037FDA7